MLINARLLLLQKNQLYIPLPLSHKTHTLTFQNEFKHFNFVQFS